MSNLYRSRLKGALVALLALALALAGRDINGDSDTGASGSTVTITADGETLMQLIYSSGKLVLVGSVYTKDS